MRCLRCPARRKFGRRPRDPSVGGVEKKNRKELRENGGRPYVGWETMSKLMQLIRAVLAAPGRDQNTREGDELARLVIAELHVFLRFARREKEEVIEEALANALKAIFEKLETFGGDTDAQFWSWCHQIARNKARDEWRGPWVERREQLDTEALWSLIEASTADAPLLADERREAEYTMQLVQRSKSPCFQHLSNHFLLGWNYQTMAEVYGISYDSAKMTIYRCLKLARELYEKHQKEAAPCPIPKPHPNPSPSPGN